MNLPNLQQGKFALLLCDRKTGHVLKQNGRDLFFRGEKEPYIIEDSLDNARSKANEFLLVNSDLEIILYDHNGDLMEIIKL